MNTKRIQVAAYFEARICALERAERFSTSRNYRRTWASFQGFLRGKPLWMDQFSPALIARYNRYLSRSGLMRNTISFYNRVLRALYNRAVREGYARQTHPFEEVYTGVDTTRKRALPTEVIHRIASLYLPYPEMALARDLFLFSFQARGMSFVDIAYLTRRNLRDNTIIYTRRKTGQLVSVLVEPWMRRIMDRWGKDAVKPYLFPIIRTRDPKAAHAQYAAGLCAHNRNLRKIGEMVRLDHTLSSYSARHSWATVARDAQVPISVISSGMGHTSERTTRIYLTQLDSAIIDQANRRVWNAVGMM
ncbi:MAG: site-specific integrase [Bacteroidales bacterium]|nr:site-specific integrase [Bacteroidales bacterium]